MTRSILKKVLIALFIVLLTQTGTTLNATAQTTETFVWVMDGGDRIGDFNLIKMMPDGLTLWEVQFGQSLAIGVDPHDGSVWAPELNDNMGNENQVVKLGSAGNVLRRVDGYRTAILSVDPNDGSVWVGVPNEDAVAKLNSDGEELLRVAGFAAAYAITVNPNDSSVWIGDQGDVLVKLDSNGQELFRRSAPRFFSNAPQQIAVDPRDDSVWYTQGDGYVTKLTADGNLLFQVDGFDRPTSVSIHPLDGSAWISDFSTSTPGAVVKLDQYGNKLLDVSFDLPPTVVSVNPEDGSVWVGIEGSLKKLSSDGVVLETKTVSGTPEAIITANVMAQQIKVDIDIKPGNKQNVINPREKGGIWVAVLSDTDPDSPFDPTSQVDIPTVEFGPDGAKAKRYKVKDINKDGLGDLLLRFKIPKTGIACGDTEATLTGETFDGVNFTGTDVIKTVGCPKEKVIRIEAHIDGRSQLILRGNTAQWHHLDYAAPGRHLFIDEPTIINETVWFPVWPDVPDEENRFCDCFSDVFKPVKSALQRKGINVNLDLIQSRGQTEIIQYPSKENRYTLIVEFDDNPIGGSDDYIVEVRFSKDSSRAKKHHKKEHYKKHHHLHHHKKYYKTSHKKHHDDDHGDDH